MFGRTPPPSPRKKWQPDDDEAVFYDDQDLPPEPESVPQSHEQPAPYSPDDWSRADVYAASAPADAAAESDQPIAHAPNAEDSAEVGVAEPGPASPVPRTRLRRWRLFARSQPQVVPLSEAVPQVSDSEGDPLEEKADTSSDVLPEKLPEVHSSADVWHEAGTGPFHTPTLVEEAELVERPREADGAVASESVTVLPTGVASQRRLRWGWLLLPPALLALAASWFALPIREVTVKGHRHLSAEQVVQAAGITPDYGWLYYGQPQAAALLDNPWIASAEVVRQFPGRVSITVTERTPHAVLQESGHEPVAVAEDGTRLPGADLKSKLPTISGWGPDRIRDALTALDATQSYGVQSVEYTPTGLLATTAQGSAWSGDLESLLKYAGALESYPNHQIHIYPWGVSVQE